MKRYGTATPPDYNLKAIKTPLALVGGKYDKLADVQDVEWLKEQLGDTAVFYQTYELGHESFAIAKDMTWFTKDVMAVLNKYNNKGDQDLNIIQE